MKAQLFLVGGLGCIAPNIVKYASAAVSGGDVSGNLAGTVLGAALFFLLAGFLVAFILEAKDIRDAFYKGVAIPTLIISLANGATAPSDKIAVPDLQTTPTGTSKRMIPPAPSALLPVTFTLVATAEAQEPTLDPARMGTLRFEVSPATSDVVTVTLMAQDGRALATARSGVPNFSLRYGEGNYIAHIETATAQARREVTVRRNETTTVTVKLEKKGLLKNLSDGVQSLMKR